MGVPIRFIPPPFLGGMDAFMEVISDPKLSKRDKIIINVMNTIGWVTVLIAMGDIGLTSVILGKELSQYNIIACAIGILVGLFFVGLSSVWPITSASHDPKIARLEYLSDRDSQLGPAIISMARESAWGRWYAAQHLVNSGVPVGLQHLYQVAAGEVMNAITNGDLEVRGRRPDPKRLEYEPIDRTHWRSSSLVCISDPIALWKMKLIPNGAVELNRDKIIVRADNPTAAERTSLLDYDEFVVDAYQFEKLWPKRKNVPDWKRRKFLWQAWWRSLNRDERRRLR